MRSALLVLALAGCTTAPTTECEAMREDLSQCLGSRLARLDCSTVADADVRRIRSLTQGTSCAVLISALPTDGDLASATCRALGMGCVSAVTPGVVAKATRYPVLLVNGIDTSPLFRYSDRIVDTLKDRAGVDVHLATLTPYEAPFRRAPELLQHIDQVLRETGARKVNLICHSLGGLDCRHLASPRGLAADLGVQGLDGYVASITTVGTAHRGTRAADALLGLTPDGDQTERIDDFASVVGDWFTPEVLQHDVHMREALQALSTVSAPRFNDDITNSPAVFYQSFAGVSFPLGEHNAALDARTAEDCTPDEASDATLSSGATDAMALTLIPFDRTVGIEAGAALPHDGFVTVRSARWGLFRGCVPADHMEQLGQRNLPDVNVSTGVDIAGFYAAITADLAKRGF